MRVLQRNINDEVITDNKHVYNDKFSKDYTLYITEKILKPIDESWFRSELVNFENFPERNDPNKPLIFVTNHSGMAFPWDAIIFNAKIIERFKFGKKSIRTLVSPFLTNHLFMHPFMIKDLWHKTGCINATFLNFETMMQFNEFNILIYPEGIDGIGKGFNKKYQLQDLKTSFVRMSVKYKTDIIPFSTVNAEYNNPLAYSSKRINKLVKKIGMPFLPIGFTTVLALLQPWIFFISFPSQLKFVCGKRIKAYEMVNKPYDELSQNEFKILAKKIRKQMQHELNEAVINHGTNPYNIKSLIKSMIQNLKKIHLYFPVFWSLSFNYYDYKYDNKANKKSSCKIGNLIKMLMKRFILVNLFIPVFGWFFIIWFSKKQNNS